MGMNTSEKNTTMEPHSGIAANEGIIDTSKSIQVGIRGGLYTGSRYKMSPDLGFKVITATQCHKIGMNEIVRQIKRTCR